MTRSLISIHNCLYLIIPLLLWNILLGPKLKQPVFTSDEHIPRWILWAENIFRLGLFIYPLFLKCRFPGRAAGFHFGMLFWGWALYGSGMCIYFASWLPHLLSLPGRTNRWIVLAPAYTPLLIFWGMSLIGASRLYFLLAVFFGIFHITHILINVSRIQ